MQYRTTTLLTIVAIAAVIAFSVSVFLKTKNGVRNAYAVWWVADMVVSHLDANNNQWPVSWKELRDDYDTCVSRNGSQPWAFDDLRSLVSVDWAADPDDLIQRQTDGNPEFRVIWIKSGGETTWADKEPNQIVLNYLNSNTD